VQSYGILDASVIDEFDISYPVADDQDRDTWRAYGVSVYPSWAFIDAEGLLVHSQTGTVVVVEALNLIEAAVGAP
jgi:hypothetical protein